VVAAVGGHDLDTGAVDNQTVRVRSFHLILNAHGAIHRQAGVHRMLRTKNQVPIHEGVGLTFALLPANRDLTRALDLHLRRAPAGPTPRGPPHGRPPHSWDGRSFHGDGNHISGQIAQRSHRQREEWAW